MSPQSPRNEWDGGVEKLTATSDFAVSLAWAVLPALDDESHMLTT